LDTERIVSVLGLVPGNHAADLGCGSGYWVVALARIVGKDGVVSAVDIRQDPLDEVRAKADALGLGNVRVIRADLEVPGATGIEHNSQDVVLIVNNLYQSQKKDAIMSEAVRMLKPDGHLVVIEWKKGAGGFGPPDDMRTSESDLTRIAESAGVRYQRPLETGSSFVGMVFIRS
jgi:ubiquinone/menaquinone biosynthesis C-methylase UbiE